MREQNVDKAVVNLRSSPAFGSNGVCYGIDPDHSRARSLIRRGRLLGTAARSLVGQAALTVKLEGRSEGRLFLFQSLGAPKQACGLELCRLAQCCRNCAFRAALR